uniref:ATP binding protein n=1 Tax=Arundo donax TaxID=35708 RepID=A0A0A9G957_ARUDO
MTGEAKHLETARADRSVWLMKCPTVVSRAWQEAAAAAAASSSAPEAGGANPNPNPVVAKVVLSLDPLREDQPLQFQMEMAQADNGNTPKSYSLNMFNDFVPMCIFSESSQGKLSCEGKVETKFDMKPHRENLVDYGKLCRERTNKYMDKPRRLQVLADDHGMRMRPMPGMVGLVPSSGAKEKKKPIPVKPSDMKRTRRDRGELENILFKLFERQPNWSLKQLMQETDQPEQFLKEILNDLCVYNKRGPNQGTHELKPEYKKCAENNDPA